MLMARLAFRVKMISAHAPRVNELLEDLAGTFNPLLRISFTCDRCTSLANQYLASSSSA